MTTVEQPRRAEPWLHPAIQVRDSAIEGRGLFASTALPAGLVVIELGGHLVGTEELMALIDSSTTYVDTFSVGPDVHVVLPSNATAHYGNHSCEPNLAIHELYSLITKRPIVADEELTIDYATITGAPSERVPCHCGAPNCRGSVEL